MRRPALFLDRDGVINEDVGFLFRPDDVRFVPGIFSLMLTAQKLGYRLVVVTNQSGIGRGFYSEEDFQAVMRWIGKELAAHGVTLDRVYHCPHHPDHGIGAYRRECDDRKPGPGMFLRAARDLDLDLSASIFVGDRLSDMQAGKAAGVGACFLLSAEDHAGSPDYPGQSSDASYAPPPLAGGGREEGATVSAAASRPPKSASTPSSNLLPRGEEASGRQILLQPIALPDYRHVSHLRVVEAALKAAAAG